MNVVQQWFVAQGYEFVYQIGQGSFGSIFSVIDEQGNAFCVKVEFLDPLEKSYLIHEAHILKTLQQLLQQEKTPKQEYELDNKHNGVLKFFSYEIITDLGTLSASKSNNIKSSANLIFMEYGGVSLSTFRQQSVIDEQMWFTIFLKMLIVMQKIHRVGVIHRDLKPQNILMRKKQTTNSKFQRISPTAENSQDMALNYELFIIDFGLARMIRKPNKEVFVQKTQTGFAGTVNYASIRAHKGEVQHYADDLESILYIMLFMAMGTLPWMNIGIKHSIEDRYQTIMIAKQHLFIRPPTGTGKREQDTRFSQFSDILSINQQKFLRFYTNAIFNQNIGNIYANPNYETILTELFSYYKTPDPKSDKQQKPSQSVVPIMD